MTHLQGVSCLMTLMTHDTPTRSLTSRLRLRLSRVLHRATSASRHGERHSGATKEQWLIGLRAYGHDGRREDVQGCCKGLLVQRSCQRLAHTHTHTRIHHCLSPSFSLSPSRVFSLALADTQRVTGRHEVPGDTSRPRSRCQCHGLRQAQVLTPTHTPPFAVYSTALLCDDLF